MLYQGGRVEGRATKTVLALPLNRLRLARWNLSSSPEDTLGVVSVVFAQRRVVEGTGGVTRNKPLLGHFQRPHLHIVHAVIALPVVHET